MQAEPLIFKFVYTTTAEGNRYADSLSQVLREVDPSVVVERQRDRPDTQDFGATLAVIAGSAAVTALAKGIAAWLARNSGAQLEVMHEGKPVLRLSHLDSADVAQIAKALSNWL